MGANITVVHQVWPETTFQGTMKGGGRQDRQRKRWEDNIREWTGLDFAKSQRAVENREKMEKTGCEMIYGAPTTLAGKGLMMMMMMVMTIWEIPQQARKVTS